jgi:two-component system sensor histidine kinase HydH
MNIIRKFFHFIEHPNKVVHPGKTAINYAFIYGVAAALYIWISGLLAERFAGDVSNLRHIELIKGTLFVLVTSILLFFLLKYLLESINAYHKKLERQQRELQRSERRALSGMLASSIGHDINNILTVSNGCVYKLEHHTNLSEDQREYLDALRQTNEDLSKLVQRLMSVGNEGVNREFNKVDLKKLTRQAVIYAKLSDELTPDEIQLETNGKLIVEGQDDLIHQMLFNLILNATQSRETNSKVRIELDENEDFAIIEIHDNGSGIPDNEKSKIFEPFYTTKSAGTGLGLLSVRACIESHNGEMDIRDSKLGGACFRVYLPKSQT